MAYDDIATYPYNPYPGKVFNGPDYEDVYDGVVIDYSGSEVNKENFLAVIAGDEEAVKGKGTGKVLKATAEDRVFLFYSDHGSIGMLCFPDQRFLYADELVHALQDRY